MDRNFPYIRKALLSITIELPKDLENRFPVEGTPFLNSVFVCLFVLVYVADLGTSLWRIDLLSVFL